MKVMVTGGTGFVGGHLIEALRRAGDEVTALVRSPAKAAGLAESGGVGRGGIRLVEGDLDNSAALRAAAAGQEVIYHVAGLIRARSAAEFLGVNRDGTARLIEAAAEANAARGGKPTIVLVSSLAAAGPVPRGSRRHGDEPPTPVTDYGRSKLAGEEVVRAGPLPWVIVRPPIVYGPGDREFLRAFKAARMGLIPVFGDGAQQLSLVFGPDLAQAISAVGRAGGEGGRETTAGRVFYPVHPEVLTTTSLVQTLAHTMGKRVRVLHLPRLVAEAGLGLTSLAARLRGRATLLTRDKAHEFYSAAWVGDPEPLAAVTGWRAEHDLRSGAEATWEWYKRMGWVGVRG